GAKVGVFERVEAALGFDAATERRPNFFAGLAEVTNGFEVVVGEAFALLEFEPVLDVGDNGGRLRKAEDISPETENTGSHVLIGAVDEADDGDDGGDADNHADER